MASKVLSLPLVLLAACSGGDDKTAPADARTADSSTLVDAPPIDIDAPGCPTTYSVDGTNGSDSAAGTCTAPFKTITHALSVAASGTRSV